MKESAELVHYKVNLWSEYIKKNNFAVMEKSVVFWKLLYSVKFLH